MNDKVIKIDVELEEGNPVEPEKLDGIDISYNYQQVNELGKGKDKEKEAVVTTLPKPPPLFPQRLKKKEDNEKFSKFMAIMKQLTVNVPLMEALEQMPNYGKFKKELLTKK